MKSSEVLLIWRQNLISVFKKYEMILMPLIRFIINLGLLYMLKGITGYRGMLGSIIALVVIALGGAFISAEWILIACTFLIPIFLMPSSLIIAGMIFVILSIVYILYGRFFPKESLFILAIIVAFPLHIELIVPVIAALFGSCASIIAIIIGIMLKFMIPELIANLTVVEKNQTTESLENLLSMDFRALTTNQTMLVTITVFFIVFMTIYLIKRLSIDYGAYIAIIMGSIMYIMGFGLAMIIFMDLQIDLFEIVLESVVIGLIAVVMQFFSVALDYQRAESVNFEDDDNYYYVRIVPKIKLNLNQNKVTKVYTDIIHSHHEEKNMINEEDFNQGI